MAITRTKKRGKTVYRYRYWDPSVGRYTVDVVRRKKSDIEEVAKQYEQAIMFNGISTDRPMRECFHTWLTEIHLLNKAEETKISYLRTDRNTVQTHALAKIKLSAFTAVTLQNLYKDVYTSKGENAMRRLAKVLSPFFRYCARVGLTDQNYQDLVTLPSDRKIVKHVGRVHPLTVEEQKKFVRYISDYSPMDEAMYKAFLLTGLREGELFALDRDDVDFDLKQLTVNKKVRYRSGKFYVEAPKTSKSLRVIPISDELCTLLKAHIDAVDANLAVSGLTTALLFPNAVGGYQYSRNVLRRIKTVYKSAGVDESHNIHDLRHTFATRLFEAKVPAKTVSTLLGHASVNETINTYTAVLNNTKRDAIDLLQL